MSRQQIPVVCYDKNHYIYPANLLVISRLAKLLMHRTIGVIYVLLLAQPFPVPPCFPDVPSLSEKLLLPTGNTTSHVWPILLVPTIILRSTHK